MPLQAAMRPARENLLQGRLPQRKRQKLLKSSRERDLPVHGGNLSREPDDPGLVQAGALMQHRSKAVAVQSAPIRVHENETRQELGRDPERDISRIRTLCCKPAELLDESRHFIALRAISIHNQHA